MESVIEISTPRSLTCIQTLKLLLLMDAPIIGIGRLSAVLPIMSIGRLLCQYRPIIVYTLGKYKFLLYCVSVF